MDCEVSLAAHARSSRDQQECSLTRPNSQYPNYFGEISLWTGIATVAAGALRTQPIQSAIGLGGGVGGITAAAAMSYISPLFAYLLLTKVSGIPMSEKKYDKKFGDRKDYQEWKKNTPRLIPKLL